MKSLDHLRGPFSGSFKTWAPNPKHPCFPSFVLTALKQASVSLCGLHYVAEATDHRFFCWLSVFSKITDMHEWGFSSASMPTFKLHECPFSLLWTGWSSVLNDRGFTAIFYTSRERGIHLCVSSKEPQFCKKTVPPTLLSHTRVSEFI